ncbi:hepatocellular carcinoma-associated antigen 59-domain-containing protein [Diplogelasinospora grovesii]|uniref:Hepatocellular carcinoma-associated antigen 59-domain-containing protein n=1 Tax=Diplogelasinospora grovesii TaxID=303347 RepID=A0AAN6N1Z3_9PEZI|nr:hepatocellular carcinoma-associated antigen 59-domain-containing protein [Diplogelasinospora grovesii]
MASFETETAGEPAPQVLFRAGKKRKMHLRQRGDDETTEHATANLTPTPGQPDSSSTIDNTTESHSDESRHSVAEVLRLRNARKSRLGGVAFRPGGSSSQDNPSTDHNTEQSMVLHTINPRETMAMGGITKRFAPQTGLVGDVVNKHMEEYIESELARRKQHLPHTQNNTPSDDQQDKSGTPTNTLALRTGTEPVSSRVKPVEIQQPATRGRLMEIDLGEEARARNVAETERARRRLQGLTAGDSSEDNADGQITEGGRPRKVRLGRDGKPLRNRNRRGSEDIKRDQLVEKFLRENKLDVYDTSSQNVAADWPEDEGGAADDRIAEEFRREFYDAMSQRRQRRKPAINAKPSANKQSDEILKGPKLGGSRNARAAMRDKLLKEQETRRR